jgi:hypothetical protein
MTTDQGAYRHSIKSRRCNQCIIENFTLPSLETFDFTKIYSEPEISIK